MFSGARERYLHVNAYCVCYILSSEEAIPPSGPNHVSVNATWQPHTTERLSMAPRPIGTGYFLDPPLRPTQFWK